MILSRVAQGSRNRCAGIDIDQVVDIGTGPQTILFLHGLFGTPEHWRDVMLHLAHDYRVIAPQLPIDPQPGRRRNGMQDISDLSNTVAEFINALDIERPVVCGNSLGGLIAIDLCVNNPEFASGLVLAGSAGLFERSPIKGLKSKPYSRICSFNCQWHRL